MEEMLEMQTIIEKATENSLVVIDELGRGTSTFDGFGLAWAITKHLASEVKAYGVFATHFHELTTMENEIPTVGNLHVKAYCQHDKLSLLYNVDKGVCDESYGINVARYTRFPEHVIASAEEKLKQFEEVPGFKNKKEVSTFVHECVKGIMGAQQSSQ
jgi:DNA mismatch repair protein MSH2